VTHFLHLAMKKKEKGEGESHYPNREEGESAVHDREKRRPDLRKKKTPLRSLIQQGEGEKVLSPSCSSGRKKRKV